MLEPDTMLAHARKVVLDVRSAVVDVDSPAVQGAMAGDANGAPAVGHSRDSVASLKGRDQPDDN